MGLIIKDANYVSTSKGLCADKKFAILRNTPDLESSMITCHLSTLMGREKLRISDVARLTQLNRSTISALYKDTCTRIDLAAVDRLCALFKCQVNDLFEYDAINEAGTK